MDMLRFHLFTTGNTWISEYGHPGEPIHFPNIYSYSPLHNIKFPEEPDTQYPAVLVLTGDHDDRVAPSHPYKYVAELQYVVGSHDEQVAQKKYYNELSS